MIRKFSCGVVSVMLQGDSTTV
ncbi:MAG: YSIRK-type signal peptide-containing protein [Bacteroidaceae bacterium]|nr:YSIRK-type signal peptide-containing protein [Bacteroidaceae bacterium]